MRYRPLSLLSIFPTSSLATPFTQRWDDVHVKHTWNSVLENRESLGPPPANTTIDLHIALNSNQGVLVVGLEHHENALINVLYGVSDSRYPNYVLVALHWATQTHSSSSMPDWTPRHALLRRLNETWRQLADVHRRPRVPSQ